MFDFGNLAPFSLLRHSLGRKRSERPWGIHNLMRSILNLPTLRHKVVDFQTVTSKARTSENDKTCFGARCALSGRSMIEMLGVLAIIGVLSVGGIAGYSKAMRNYYSNQQKRALEQLIITVTRLKDKVGQNVDSVYLTDIIEALNDIPEELTVQTNSWKQKYFKDRLGNDYWPHAGATQWVDDQGVKQRANNDTYISITLSKGSIGLCLSTEDLCYNIVIFAQQNPQLVNLIDMRYSQTNSTYFYRKDLASITPNQIKNACHKCTTQSSCSSVIYMH